MVITAASGKPLELIASGAVPVQNLITHALPLTDVLKAIDTVAEQE